jgi:hypothetical protein
MVRAGAFEDVDIAITWHPSAFCEVADAVSLANTRIDFYFKGRASHAASAPHLGRSALDAVELMNVGVNYMREHMPSNACVHYALLDAGGIAPNVVQASATVRYLIRARELPDLTRLIGRVKKIAQGAALMTETSVEMKVVSAVSNLLGNLPLEQAMFECWQRLGPRPFDESDRAFAHKIQTTLSDEDVNTAYRRVGVPRGDAPLCQQARVPALGVAPIGSELVGRGVIVKLGVSPSAGVQESLAIPLDEINVPQGVRHHRRSGGLRTLFRFPMDLRNLGAVGEMLAVAGNAGPAGVDHHGIGEDHSEHVLGNMNLFRMAAYVLRVWLPAVGLHTLQIENGKRPALELRTQQ